MHPKLFEIGPITVYTYGVLLAAAYLLGLQLAIYRSKKAGLDSGRVLDLGVYLVIAALVGAKLLLILVNYSYFRTNPKEILALAQNLMLSSVLPRVYEQWWRPAMGRVAKGVFGPGMADVKQALLANTETPMHYQKDAQGNVPQKPARLLDTDRAVTRTSFGARGPDDVEIVQVDRMFE